MLLQGSRFPTLRRAHAELQEVVTSAPARAEPEAAPALREAPGAVARGWALRTQMDVRRHMWASDVQIDPWARASHLEMHRSPHAYVTSSDFRDGAGVVYHAQDLLPPGAVHWGKPVVSDDVHFELFNHAIGYAPTFQDNLAPRNDSLPTRPWVSRFPGVVHLPEETTTFEIDVQLHPAYAIGARALYDLFGRVELPGCVDVPVPVAQLQALLASPELLATNGVVMHRIELCEVHSTLPVPVQVQLQTARWTRDQGEPSNWFRQARTNALASHDTGRASCVLGALTVFPDTHHVHTLPAPLFESAEITRGPDFQRWINTTLEQARASLHRLGDVYRQDTPEEVEAPMCRALPPLKRPNDRVEPSQVPESARDVRDLASFVCLDEWRRLEQMATSHHYDLAKQCVMEYDEHADRLFFKVDHRLLDHVLQEKFTGPMDRALHVARTDQPWVVRVALQHTEAGDFAQARQRLRQTLEALHPTVAFPVEAASAVRTAPAARADAESAPEYSLQLRLRVSCARLESLVLPRAAPR